MRRVVVTGLGMVSPLGGNVEDTWSALLAGKSGIGPITRFDASEMACRIAGEVKKGDGTGGTFNPDEWMEPKEQRRNDEFIVFAVAAAEQAIRDAGLELRTEEEKERAGVLVGSGIGGLASIERTSLQLREKGPRRVSPFFIPGSLINLAGGIISIRHGLKGPNSAVVTACATGAHAIGDAAAIIARGDADVMVAGGCEQAICPIGIAGFLACRALSTSYNDTPEKASRPWDEGRDGFVMGEGAGIVVLEEYERAKARGAKIYAELVGYGMSGDAYHITSPAEDGDGAWRCMKMAVEKAGLQPGEIDYINAHGTSTPKGDEIELKAVERLLGNRAGDVAMSSTKSAIGHLLGAAGAVEAIFSVLAIRDQVAPPTLNLENPSMETQIDLCANEPREREINVALSNSFGFGGTNAALVFRRMA